jgi:RNA polymerase subunit RPABC4/transcription elongation factor Spt4
MDPNMPTYYAYIWNIVTLESMMKFFALYYIILWVVLSIWVMRDISLRTKSFTLRVFSLFLIVFFHLPGFFIYLLIRPGKNYTRLLRKEAEENLDILSEIISERIGENLLEDVLTCPACYEKIQEDFIVCPHCKLSLKHPCNHCEREIRSDWKVCPYCQEKQKRKKKKKKS